MVHVETPVTAAVRPHTSSAPGVEPASPPPATGRPPRLGMVRHLAQFEWIYVPLAIFGLARLLSGIALSWASRFQTAVPANGATWDHTIYFGLHEAPPDPGFLGVATNWDGQWYEWLATAGHLQSTDPSSAASWAWAFPPGYPWVVRGVMQLTHLGFAPAAVLTSTVSGALAMVLLYRLLRGRMGSWPAAVGVATTSFFVSSPLLGVAYSESLGLLLVIVILGLVGRGRWWSAVPFVIALALVRVITPPLAIVALLTTLHGCRRRGRPPAGDLVPPAVFAIASLVGPLIWPTSARLLLRGDGSGVGRVSGALDGNPLGWFGAFYAVSPVLLILLLATVASLWRVMRDPGDRLWGTAVGTWGWAYPLFVLIGTGPTTGIVRYLLLAFPLGLPLAVTTRHLTRGARAGLLVPVCLLLLLGQVLWIRHSFIVAPYGTTP